MTSDNPFQLWLSGRAGKRARRAATLLLLASLAGCAAVPAGDELRINQLQFVGSHNSYKQAMSPQHVEMLKARSANAAASLAYEHPPLSVQLDMGLRKLELDVFASNGASGFPVGHVQVIDMNSHCDFLRSCLQQIRQWSDAHPQHVPIWISFNAKDQVISGLPDPAPFDATQFARLDALLESVLGDRLIRPSQIEGLNWPTLAEARGRFLLILDEQGSKREIYWQGWRERPMFTNAPPDHAAAAVMIVNDPLGDGELIADLVQRGYLVRTRADADTREARSNETRRRDAAFDSGAHAVSTDYYMPSNPFGTPYRVLPRLRCNPVTVTAAQRQSCTVEE